MTTREEEELEMLEQAIADFGTAWACGDMLKLKSLLSPTYSHNDAFGRQFSHADWIAYAAKRTGRETHIAFRDVKIRRFAYIAIVTGFNDVTGSGATSPEDSLDLTIAFIQIWRLDNSRWLREAFQATPVIDETAR